MADDTAAVPAAEEKSRRPALVFDDPLSRPSRDDTDSGWGGGESGRDEAWYRRETPPHHGS
ncbi:hypothetical protein [Streptacidiphilus sp. MAP12-16]|uniref:hypothetical protein n=1 Tax=Streptacidiphilus sp. MAP12-16 TaxID=3156300 RepID=UPI003512E66E